MARGETVLSLELKEVIKIRAVVGTGENKYPVRVVDQYWDKSGEKLAEKEVEVKVPLNEEDDYRELTRF